MDMVTLYCSNYPETKLFTGKNLALGGSLKSHRSGTFTSLQGDVSAIIIQHLPFWAEYFRAPDRSIALMDEWSEKLEHMAQQMCREKCNQFGRCSQLDVGFIKSCFRSTAI